MDSRHFELDCLDDDGANKCQNRTTVVNLGSMGPSKSRCSSSLGLAGRKSIQAVRCQQLRETAAFERWEDSFVKTGNTSLMPESWTHRESLDHQLGLGFDDDVGDYEDIDCNSTPHRVRSQIYRSHG